MKDAAIAFLEKLGYPLYDDDDTAVKSALFSVGELSCYSAWDRAGARGHLAMMEGDQEAETAQEAATETAHGTETETAQGTETETAQETVAETEPKV
jgi:hypothetical protein